MVIRFCAAMVLGVVLAGCAAVSTEVPDKVILDQSDTPVVSIERTGLLFGSIGFVPRDQQVSALSVHLRSVDGKARRYEFFVTNRTTHAQWRAPDIDTESQRLWAFHGNVPVGRYEIAQVAFARGNEREVEWLNFKPAIPVTVTAEGAVYLGRWQFTPFNAPRHPEQVRIPGSDLVLRDLPDEDQLLLVRRRGDSPIGQKPIDDVQRNMREGAGRP